MRAHVKTAVSGVSSNDDLASPKLHDSQVRSCLIRIIKSLPCDAAAVVFKDELGWRVAHHHGLDELPGNLAAFENLERGDAGEVYLSDGDLFGKRFVRTGRSPLYLDNEFAGFVLVFWKDRNDRASSLVGPFLSGVLQLVRLLNEHKFTGHRIVAKLDQDPSKAGRLDVLIRLGNRWARLAQGLAIVLMISLGALAYYSYSRHSVLVDQSARTIELIHNNSEKFRAVVQAEAAQRGYLLTGDPKYLRRFDDIRNNLQTQSFESVFSDLPADEIDQLNKLNAATRAKMLELEQTVELRKAGRTKETMRVVNGGGGLALMESIDRHFEEFDRRERAEMRRIRAEARQVRKWAAGSIYWGGLALLVISVISLLITQRVWKMKVELKRRLSESNAYTKSIVDSLPDGIFILNDKDEVIEVNAPRELLSTGFTAKSLGTSLRTTGEPVWDTAFAEAKTELLKGRPYAVFNYKFEAISGVKVVEVRILQFGSGGTLMCSRDISDIVVAEQTISVQNQKLHESGRLSEIGKMTAGMAHEINNPLSIIRLTCSNIRLMIESPEIDLFEILSSLERVDHTVERISRILKSLRNMTRFDEKADDPMALVDIRDVIDQAFDLCREKFKMNNVELSCHVLVKDPQVHCHPVQLSQVIVNLLANSFDAVVGSENPWVKVYFEGTPENVSIDVVDSGHGIPEEARQRLFELFYTTKPVGAGTGIGLHFSREIMRQHGGDLECVVDAMNTTFRVAWPRQAMKTNLLNAA